MDTVRVATEDDGSGKAVTYRLTVFYGRPTGGSLKAGDDTEAAGWVDLDDIEALPMTPGTADLARRASGAEALMARFQQKLALLSLPWSRSKGGL